VAEFLDMVILLIIMTLQKKKMCFRL